MRVGALKLKLQIACGDGFAIGPGKADLLGAIERERSISGAGRAMGMSYRRAWLLVDEMNRSFRSPVVEARAGGGRDRGAQLTPLGRDVLAAYRDLEHQSAALVDTPAFSALNAVIRSTPMPPKTS